jgi:hypothetical protein
MRPLVALVVVISTSALACDTVARTVEFLGWTQDSTFFVWKVTDRAVCGKGGCDDPWVTEIVRVTSTSVTTKEYVLRFDSKEMQPPPFGTKKDFEAWSATHPLAKVSTSAVSPVEPETTLLATAKVPLKQQGNTFFVPRSDTPARFTMTVKSAHEVTPRHWDGGRNVCNSVRGYWSPDGHFVAWLTSPPKSSCSECAGAAVCCPYPEGLPLAVRW